MNIAIIGLGSMGCRRLRLIKKYDQRIHIFGVDSNVKRLKQCEDEFKIKGYSSLGQLKTEELDAVFVCTSPVSHSKIINECLQNSLHVFTEINLVDDLYEENIQLANEKNLVLFLSSTPMYREEINFIDQRVKEQAKPVNYSYHVGQYLPDWHPLENYQDFFVGDKRTNGCRELFAIEMPWLINTFGEIKDFQVVKSKTTDLDINYNDNYLLILKHENGNKGMLAIDIVSRKAVRNLEIFGEDLYISWKGVPESLYEYYFLNKKNKQIKLYKDVQQLDNYNDFVVENAYYNEIVNFFEVVSKKDHPKYSFEKDKKMLKLIGKIEN